MYRAVARILRGDVACLIAGIGVLAFVVTTNAEKLVHVAGPATDAPQPMKAAADIVRSSTPVNEPDRVPDLRLAIPRPATSDAPNGGSASGGIAGGDPFSSQSSGFEVGEGFAVGYIGGQVGWAAFAASDAEAHVDTDNPATGDQHLRIGHDPAVVNPLANVGAFSPNMHSSENISALISVDVYVTGSGRDYEVSPQSPSEGLVLTRVRFSRVANRIEVLDDPDLDGTYTFEDTGDTYTPDQYVNLTIDWDADAGTLDVSYDKVLIYSVIAQGGLATAAQEVVFSGINGVDSPNQNHADFDNYDLAGGPLPTGACCNSDGMDGCIIVSAPECAGLTDAFYLGDDTLCGDCPPVDPSCGPGAGDCLTAHDPDPGCDDIECCALVCDALPFCCVDGFGWNQSCVDAAIDTFCVPDPACGVVGTGSCTEGNTTPFCDDTCGPAGACPGCCETVCEVDPFCCGAAGGFWDVLCDGEAVALCGCEPIDVPDNDDCVAAIEVFVGPAVPVSNICGTAGPPDHGICNDTFVTGLGIDVWYFHNATFDGALNVTPTPDDDVAWNTQLAVYEGCDCGALLDPEPFVCAPIDGIGVVPVTNGTCYLIRLGGTFDGPTGTGTLQLSAVPDACLAAANDCLSSAGTAGCNDLSCCAVVCQLDPTCCDTAWDQQCADLAQFNCEPLPCPALDTAGANVDEAEACGLDTNGGCNTDPAPPFNFTAVASGDVVHGTAWADVVDLTPSRDTDWYSLTIDPAADINLDGMVDVYYSVVSELPIVSFLIRDIDPICGPDFNDPDLVSTIAYGQSCACVNPGVGTVATTDLIYVFAGTGDANGGTIFEGYPCGVGPPTFGNSYLLSIDVVDNGAPSPQVCGASVTPCPWDCEIAPDGAVGINDFLALLGQWTLVDSSCDIDGGGVGINDFLALLANWGPCP